MGLYTLNYATYVPSWVAGQPISGPAITEKLTALGVNVTLCDPDSRTGLVTVQSDTDPAPVLAGQTFGLSQAETTRQHLKTEFSTAYQQVQAAATSADALAALKSFATATRDVLRFVDAEMFA